MTNSTDSTTAKARVWSEEQTAIFDYFEQGLPNGHAVVDAVAGSGKSTVVVEAVRRYLNTYPRARVLVCAFNTHARDDLALKFNAINEARPDVKTLHQIGYRMGAASFRGITLDRYKGKEIARQVCMRNGHTSIRTRRGKREIVEDVDWAGRIAKLASLAKNTMAASEDDLHVLIESYTLSDETHDANKLVELTLQALQDALTNTKTFDFDDQLWLPLRYQLESSYVYDLVVIDEAQDMAAVQLWLADRVLAENARLAIVGDVNQAIYAFRSANTGSFVRLVDSLNALRFPLTTSYRCSQAVAQEVQNLVPNFKAAPEAIEGSTQSVDAFRVYDMPVEGDFVLSRYNYPLVRIALALISRGKRACIAGKDIAGGLIKLIDQSKATTAVDLRRWLDAYIQEQTNEMEGDKEADKPMQEAIDQARALLELATQRSFEALRATLDALFVDDFDPKQMIVCSTVHKCVAPNTIVERPEGLNEIADIPTSGVIATPTGAHRYKDLVYYEKRKMIRITTRSGYSVSITRDHGMDVWNGRNYERKEGRSIREGDRMRLCLGVVCDPLNYVSLPSFDETLDVRAVEYDIPNQVTEDVAEFFGLIVADGTVYGRGCRLLKRHDDVVRRTGELAEKLFGIKPTYCQTESAYAVELNSVHISRWLNSIGGMSPRNKYVPLCILASPLSVQACFLRGLFEDGTVNTRSNGTMDHFAWMNKSDDVVRMVQTMLLRFGIISRIQHYDHTDNRRNITRSYLRLSVFGTNAHRLAKHIGTVSKYKRDRLRWPTSRETSYTVPITLEEIHQLQCVLDSVEEKSTISNAKTRGHLSRALLSDLIITHKFSIPESLKERLQWHHEQVVAVEHYTGPAMCVSVPNGEQFLQNGFAGWNSKGQEARRVFLIWDTFKCGADDSQEERNITYVAMSRALEDLYYVEPVTDVEKIGNRMPVKSCGSLTLIHRS